MNHDNEHEPVDLVGLLAGELPVAERAALRTHLAGCDTCLHQLAETAFVVGELRDAARHGIVEPSALPPLVSSGASSRRAHVVDASAEHPVVERPWREQPAALTAPAAGQRRRPRSRVLALAAAVLAAAVAGGVVAGRLTASSTVRPARAAAVVRLVPTGSRPSLESAVARMAGPGAQQHMDLTVSDLATLPGGEHYEVWLINLRTGRALAVGIVPLNGAASYPAPQATVRRFTAIDVTVQTSADHGRHSAHSVLRGLL